MLDFSTSADEATQYCKEVSLDWPLQRDADTLAKELYLQQHVIDVTDVDEGVGRQGAAEDTNEDIVAVGLGRGALMCDQDAAYISAMFNCRVNPAGTSPDALSHANTLERFGDGALLRMEELAPEPQWPKIRKDVILFGRGSFFVLPVPQNWSGPDFYRKKGESQEEAEARRQTQMRQRFPIMWRHLPAPDTHWRFYGDDKYVCVNVRRRKAGELGRFYDTEFEGDDGWIDVYTYLDDTFYGMWAEGKELRKYQHLMHLNPAVLLPGNPLPDNPWIKYAGALYHARHALKAMDNAVSDVLTNLRRDTRAATIVEHDPDHEEVEEGGGSPEQTLIPPGGQIDVWKGAKIYRLGAAESNRDYSWGVGQLQASIEDTGIRRVLMGPVKSDVTGTATRMAGEYAQVELNDVASNIRAAGRKCFIRIFHSVTALEEGVKRLRKTSKADKVYVRYRDQEHKSSEIAAGPKDVVGYDDLVQARWQLTTPTDERSLWQALRLAVEDTPGVGPLMDIWKAREKAGDEDPLRTQEMVTLQRAVNGPAFLQKIDQLAGERLNGIISGRRDEFTPEEIMALQALGISQDILATLTPEGTMPPEPPGQGGGPSMLPSANEARAGEQEMVQAPR